MNKPTNIADHPEAEESTYALLTRSEEKNRNRFEMAVHSVLMLSIVVAIWQFIHRPTRLQPAAGKEPLPIVCAELQTLSADHLAKRRGKATTGSMAEI